jgi:hypothetical protein
VRLLHETFAARLARAFTPDDYAAVFADPDQLSLFTPPASSIRTILHKQPAMAPAGPDPPERCFSTIRNRPDAASNT